MTMVVLCRGNISNKMKEKKVILKINCAEDRYFTLIINYVDDRYFTLIVSTQFKPAQDLNLVSEHTIRGWLQKF